jgi:dTDP-4-amino-4,6-dideoxygalactose transaminase
MIRDAERRGIPMRLAARSRSINDGQAGHALDHLEQTGVRLAGASVTVWGLAFRPDVKETTLSTAFLLHQELVERGARVRVADPLFTHDEIRDLGLVPADVDDPADVVVLNTAHTSYLEPDFTGMARRGVVAVLDGRNAWSPEAVRAAGLLHVGIGTPTETAPEASAAPGIPVARPTIGADEELAAADVVGSGWLLQGAQVRDFEDEFAAYTGAEHACAVSSGTAALHLALLALGIGPDDEVLTVSHSFIATANSIALTGATPVFVDVEPGGFNVDVSILEQARTDATRALVVVHQFGLPCDLTAARAFCLAHDLHLVEDAACAIGSEIHIDGSWQRIGAPHGDIATFSFHPRKVMTTGEGGMVVTASADLDERVRMLRQQGSPDGMSFPLVGFNYRMTDIQAALGRRQLQRVPHLVADRRRLAERYGQLLAGCGLRLPVEPVWARANYQSYCLLLPDDLDAAEVGRELESLGIGARGAIRNAHRQPAYTGAGLRMPLPESERAERQGLCLPLYPGMTEDDQERVVAALLTVIDALRTEKSHG